MTDLAPAHSAVVFPRPTTSCLLSGNLIRAEAPYFDADLGHKGKVYDGLETPQAP